MLGCKQSGQVYSYAWHSGVLQCSPLFTNTNSSGSSRRKQQQPTNKLVTCGPGHPCMPLPQASGTPCLPCHVPCAMWPAAISQPFFQPWFAVTGKHSRSPAGPPAPMLHRSASMKQQGLEWPCAGLAPAASQATINAAETVRCCSACCSSQQSPILPTLLPQGRQGRPRCRVRRCLRARQHLRATPVGTCNSPWAWALTPHVSKQAQQSSGG